MESIPARMERDVELRRQEELWEAEREAPPPARCSLPSGRGTIYLKHGGWERGLIQLTENWAVCALERPTAAGVGNRTYRGTEVERVDFDAE
jgi:hypothetical protein